MNRSVSPSERDAFYAAALVGLRALDVRERVPRRFGADADRRWLAFWGTLGVRERLDVLVRDASGTWGAAFSPALAFGLFGLADDEPFGPDWDSLPEERARRLLAEPPELTLAGAAVALGVSPGTLEHQEPGLASRFVVAGGGPILALAGYFSANPALSWTDQVAVVASRPAHRQLAALAAVLLGARGRTVLVWPTAAAPELMAAGFGHASPVISSDAEPDAAAAVRALARGR